MRFATQVGSATDADAWFARIRRLEALGYSTIAMPDHVVGQAWSPFPALAATAVATERVRLGTLVLANDFRSPLLMAREASTVDVLSGGRLELGLGAGWLDRDYQGLGMPFDRGRTRVARLREALTILKRLWSEDEVTFEGRYYRVVRAECRPRPVQRPHPPILIAGGGDEILRVAGEMADIVAIVSYGAGQRRPTVDQVSVDAVRQQIAIVRGAAGARWDQIELSIFVDVNLTDDPDAFIRDLVEKQQVDPEVPRRSVYRHIGTLDGLRDHLVRVRDATGISYFCLRGPHIEEFGPIVKELSGT